MRSILSAETMPEEKRKEKKVERIMICAVIEIGAMRA